MSDEKILMPKELTAENGAKGLLSGEFSEQLVTSCPVCWYSDDEANDGCQYCEGSGEIVSHVSVSWTTIKEIYAMAAKHLGEKA